MKSLRLLNSRPVLFTGFLVTVFSLILAACAPSGASAQNPYGINPATPTSPASSGTPIVPVTGSGEVQVASNPKLGQILVTPSGMTLYTFEADKPGVSNCTSSECVQYWPPYVASTQPGASNQVPGKLGLITRSDSSMQVTYNDLPLYTFIGDKKPGDTTGDNLNQSGGIWHAIVIGGASNASSEDTMGSGTYGGSGGGY